MLRFLTDEEKEEAQKRGYMCEHLLCLYSMIADRTALYDQHFPVFFVVSPTGSTPFSKFDRISLSLLVISAGIISTPLLVFRSVFDPFIISLFTLCVLFWITVRHGFNYTRKGKLCL